MLELSASDGRRSSSGGVLLSRAEISGLTRNKYVDSCDLWEISHLPNDDVT